MAQLIKLHQYPSRYETDIYQYSGRFPQIKQRRYQSFLDKYGYIKLDEDAKEKFFDELFKSQLIWATSTPKKESATTKEQYRFDKLLKLLLRMFNDTALILYQPTFLVEDTEVDGNLIILTPQAVWCIQVVSGEKESVFQGVNVQEWKELTSSGERKLPNPFIALSHTLEIVKHIFNGNNMEAIIKGCVYAPESYVEFVKYGTSFEVVDRTKVKDWVDKINNHRSTLKHGQLRAAELLLKYTKTIGIGRI